ncbi:ferredoxin [Streptomyces justiciae]|uniref:ferredoxin n=1 Tax=Streptomyces justiciae TaxID=2780140 RepID=UPI002117DE59|nr:ferredoxin [Streptomyces justiciae]MCW8375674.1 ferredoxin [Streptomyces justiciae]
MADTAHPAHTADTAGAADTADTAGTTNTAGTAGTADTARVGIRVDRDSCVGSGACALFEPEFFDQSEEDGLVVPRVREAGAEALPALRRAASRCPARAITLVPSDGQGSAGWDRSD